MPETVLKDRYEIKDILGRGGMGAVYRAFDRQLQREVAIKIIETQHSLYEATQRFRREYRALASLNHPNIVHVFDVCFEERQNFLVMELIEGVTLSRFRLAQGGKIECALLNRLTLQIVKALEAIHDQGLIHRDLTPNNIMVSGQTVKLMDFGLVKPQQSEMSVTAPGVIVGTLNYISPEQGRGLEVDSRSDLYSLGVVLYEALTGELPFRAGDPIMVIFKHITETPLPPRALAPETPAEWERIVLQLMAKTPELRYQSAEELLLDLERLLGQPSEKSHGSAAVRADLVFKAPLLAREHELSELSAAFAEIKTGGIFVWVAGEAGSGKTRLLQEFSQCLNRQDVQTLFLECVENEGFSSQPVLELARQLQTETVRLSLGAAQQTLTDDAFEEALKMAMDSASAERKYALYARIVDRLELLAKKRGVLLVIDNMQWSDGDTREFCSFLARHLDQAAIMAVGIFRDEELTGDHSVRRLQAIIRRAARTLEIKLSRLSAVAVEALVAAMLGDKQLAGDIGGQVFQETEGNPLFLHELIKMWIEEGKLCRNRGYWSLRTIQLSSVPGTIKDLVNRRRQQLSKVAQSALDSAAVIGSGIIYELLQAVGNFEEEELLDGLDELIRGGLLLEHADRTGERYEFSHHQIAKVTYDEIPKTRRRVLHRRLAEALLECYDESRTDLVPALAAHCFLGQLWLPASRFNAAAGWLAQRQLAWEQAARNFQQALASLAKAPDDPQQRMVCTVSLICNLSWSSNVKGVLETLPEAMRLIAENGTPRLLKSVFLAVEHSLIMSNKWSEMDSFLTEFAAIAAPLEDANLSAVIAMGQGFWARHTHPPEIALRYFEQSFSLFTPQQDNLEDMATVLRELGNVHILLNDGPRALEYHAAVRKWRADHNLTLSAYDLFDYAIALQVTGRCDEALELAREALDTAATGGLQWIKGNIQYLLGELQLMCGNWPQSIHWFKEARRECEKQGSTDLLLQVLEMLLWLLLFAGAADEVENLLANLESPAAAPSTFQTQLFGFRILHLLFNGRVQEASDKCAQFETPHDTDQYARALVLLSKNAVLLGQHQWELVLQGTEAPALEVRLPAMCWGYKIWLKAMALAHLARWAEAEESLQPVLNQHDKTTWGWQWLIALDFSILLHRAGHTSRASELREFGLELVERAVGSDVASFWETRRSFHIPPAVD